jgi:hypothetical protein
VCGGGDPRLCIVLTEAKEGACHPKEHDNPSVRLCAALQVVVGVCGAPSSRGADRLVEALEAERRVGVQGGVVRGVRGPCMWACGAAWVGPCMGRGGAHAAWGWWQGPGGVGAGRPRACARQQVYDSWGMRLLAAAAPAHGGEAFLLVAESARNAGPLLGRPASMA